MTSGMTIATYQPHSVSVRNIPRIDLALDPWMLSLQERLNNETDLRFRHARRCAAALLGVPAGAGYVAVVGRRLTGKISPGIGDEQLMSVVVHHGTGAL